MNSMDVPSLARQMQMNMLMPSLLLPQQMGGLPSTAGMLNMNPDIINQDVIRASLGQPALASSLPNQSATMPNIVHQVAPSNGAGSAGFRCNHLHIPRAFRHTPRAWRRRIKLHLHQVKKVEEEDNLAETEGGTAVLPNLDQTIVDLPGIIDVIVVTLVEVVLSELLLTLRVNWMWNLFDSMLLSYSKSHS